MKASNTLPTPDVALAGTLIYNIREQAVNEKEIHAALEAGKTVAFKHTAAGQPGKIIPGLEIPHGLALFAVKQEPIPGHPGRKHIITTIIPEEIPTTIQSFSAEKGAQESRKETFSLSEEEIEEEIKKHMQLQVDLVNSLTPPAAFSAYWTPVTQNFPFNPGYTQNFWSYKNGSGQTVQVVVRQTYYVYLTQNGGQTQFNIIVVQNGYSQASANGGIVANDGWEKVFLNSDFHLKQSLSGCTNAYASSPTTSLNSSTPIPDSISVPFQLICRQGGKSSIQSFTPQYSNSVLSTDWGIILQQDSGNIDWCYYTTNPWNSTQQYFQDFGNWWGRMYDGDDNVVSINNQCTGAVNFDSVSLWNTPASKGMTSLNVNFGYSSYYYFVGFANPSGTGNGHHQMVQASPSNNPNPSGYDLISITGSYQYFNS
ncbi:hypothetical protein [Chitinophaga varians]|uniref:hypothetical protein n=1 Tax=Chitinophaga varians TaxID=2202339 RepID=UPI00165FD41F|nr:hypothetical protein [Chitinophaga varians]MBC9909457.1 hypothetical protein [Chitinophaga varians]